MSCPSIATDLDQSVNIHDVLDWWAEDATSEELLVLTHDLLDHLPLPLYRQVLGDLIDAYSDSKN